MIPVSTSIVQTDTLPGKEYGATIGDPRWVMQSLADLYSNKELAVTREYSTNARDAMVEAGKSDQPIEVALPSVMSPYFKVRDYGTGMSYYELTETYLSFGNSTKRDSNNYNGVLGFGSKSAIAYTETFTVTSIKYGRKIVAVISRKPDYSIVLKVVLDEPTDEASGTEVVVPVHNWQEFTHKANDFYRFWTPGTVVVNGEFPAQAVGEKISDNVYYYDEADDSYVVMGNVGYRIENPGALFHSTRINHVSFVAYVPNGAVEFVPSREALKYTENTKNTLRKVVSDFETKILAQAKDEIENASNHFEAFSKWSKWTSQLGQSLFSDLEFKGEKLVSTFKINGMRYRTSSYSYSTHRIYDWEVNSMKNTLIVTGFTPILASAHKAKVREYAKLKDMSMTYAIFTAAPSVDCPWVDPERVIDWEDLKDALPKKPKKVRVYSGGPRRIPGTFDYWTKKGKHYEEEIPEDVTVYYVRIKDVRPVKDNVIEPAKVLQVLQDDGVVVELAANRIDKFVRDNPSAIDFLKHFEPKVVKKGGTLLSDDAKRALRIGLLTIRWLEVLDVDKIDDPAFKEVKSLVKNKNKLMEAYEANIALAYALNMHYNVERYRADGSNDNILTPYPILSKLHYHSQDSLQKEHTYIYLNAAYAARKDNK